MADLFSDAAAPGSSSSPEILFETRRVAELHAEIDAKEEGNRQKISSSYTTWPILAYDPPIVNTRSGFHMQRIHSHAREEEVQRYVTITMVSNDEVHARK